jgi:hypothetical protein
MAFNQISALPYGLFGNNLNLITIDFSENAIYSIYNKMFSHLSDLIWLDLSGNECVNYLFWSTENTDLEKDLRKCMIPTFIDYHRKIYEQFKNLDKAFKSFDEKFKAGDESVLNFASSIAKAAERLRKIEEKLEIDGKTY